MNNNRKADHKKWLMKLLAMLHYLPGKALSLGRIDHEGWTVKRFGQLFDIADDFLEKMREVDYFAASIDMVVLADLDESPVKWVDKPELLLPVSRKRLDFTDNQLEEIARLQKDSGGRK